MPRRKRRPSKSRGIRLVQSPADIRGDHCVMLVKTSAQLNAVLALPAPSAYRRVWGLCAPFVIRSEILPAVLARFERIIYFDAPDHVSSVMQKAIAQFDASVVVGSLFDPAGRILTLMRGDLAAVVVPQEVLSKHFAGINGRPQLSDDGTRLVYGDKSVPVVDVLMEVDPVFRREYRRQMWAQQRDLASRVRHLRKLRRARREDFPGLTSKTIARIERGEIKMPQRETLRLIAIHLGVDADQLLAGL